MVCVGLLVILGLRHRLLKLNMPGMLQAKFMSCTVEMRKTKRVDARENEMRIVIFLCVFRIPDPRKKVKSKSLIY